MKIDIQNYQLIQKIGEGGFGEVWIAKTVTDKKRALKVVHKSKFREEGLTESHVDRLFQLEFNGVKRFEDISNQSDGVISIYSVGLDSKNDYLYYVMPLADSVDSTTEENTYAPLTLDRYILDKGRLSLEESLAHLINISKGVAALHLNGLVHRDLSSLNILSIDGRFSVADPGMISFTSDMILTVSRGFSPPDEKSNASSDIYSIGKIFYHMITGKHPAEHYPLLPESLYENKQFDDIITILDGCCNPLEADRYQSISELLDFLNKQNEPRKRSKWRRWWVVLAVVLASLVTFFVFRAKFTQVTKDTTVDFVEFEENKIIAKNKLGKICWEKKLDYKIHKLSIADLDEDGKKEIICAIRNIDTKKTGKLIVFDNHGVEKWSYIVSLDFHNYPYFGSADMALVDFRIADLDNKKGKEIILQTRNVLNWYPEGLCILEHDGVMRSYYWHPGRIFEDTMLVVRETPDSLPCLVFSALNNRLGKAFSEVKCHRYILTMINPRATGQHEAPPGQGMLEGKDDMTVWYKILDPQHAQIRSVHTEDSDNDGKLECVAWVDYGGIDENADKRINMSQSISFEGKTLRISPADGHVSPARLRSPDKSDERAK